MWQAVDNEDEVLDFLVKLKRNAKEALKFMRKLLRNTGSRQYGLPLASLDPIMSHFVRSA